MSKIRELLSSLSKDPRIKGLLKAVKEPENAEEAADEYASIAEKLGVSLPKEEVLTFLKDEEEKTRSQTEKADEAVKLSTEDLNQVAGGASGYVKDHPECDTTYTDHEWCWASDFCSVIINYYDAPDGSLNNLPDNCANNSYGDKMNEEIFTPDPEDDFYPTGDGSVQVWCTGLQ